MRIIGGKYKGTPLLSMDGENTRPTLDRIKEAVFSAIQFELQGKNVLDLFAGSGQLALEALSRGAAYALMCDSNINAYNVIKKNIIKTGAEDCDIVNMDFTQCIKTSIYKFDIVFLDPPYKSGLIHKTLYLLQESDILSENAIIIIEKSAEDTVTDDPGYKIRKVYKYGKIQIVILVCCKQEEEEF